MSATFINHEINTKLKNKRKLSHFLDSLTVNHGFKNSKLQYIFCNDDYLLNINQEFLKHDTLTDIVTFDLTEKPGFLLGEIYISIDRVTENALKLNINFEDELLRVIFHGALHLCGYKDKKTEDKQKMTQMEDECLKNYKIFE